MSDFKVGDWVECVDADDSDQILRVGEKYQVASMGPAHIRVALREGNKCFRKSRFKPTTPPDNNSIPEPSPAGTSLKAGDWVECVNLPSMNAEHLTVGKRYRVVSFNPLLGTVMVENDAGRQRAYFGVVFHPVTIQEESNVEFKAGDWVEYIDADDTAKVLRAGEKYQVNSIGVVAINVALPEGGAGVFRKRRFKPTTPSDNITAPEPSSTDAQLRYNNTKLDTSLMPPDWVALICRIKQLGAHKYQRNNWRKGAKPSDYIGSLIRHLVLWQAGEDNDEDDSLESHLGHIAWNALACYSSMVEGKHEDDRDKLSPEALRQLKKNLEYILPEKYRKG